MLAEREYYRSQAIRGFHRLSHLQEQQGEYQAALDALGRLSTNKKVSYVCATINR